MSIERSHVMTPAAARTLEQLKRLSRPASVAQVGGFRPLEDPISSWFFRGMGLPGEGLPLWRDKPMFPLLQIRMDELPFVPAPLKDVSLLVLFHNTQEHPFDLPHGEGWLIREYRSLEGLVPLPRLELPYRPFPVRWHEVSDDMPGWEDAWELLDMTTVNEDEAAGDAFWALPRYRSTKVGGFPSDVQHAVGIEGFVFQVGSEEKTGWMWADNGFGYFHRSADGEWRFSCQFY